MPPSSGQQGIVMTGPGTGLGRRRRATVDLTGEDVPGRPAPARGAAPDALAGRAGEPRISVILVSDDSIFRAGLGAILGAERGIRLRSVLDYGPRVSTVVQETEPDIVLLDTDGKVDGALAQLTRIRVAAPASRIVALGSRDELHIAEACIRRGGSGYLLKCVSHRLLVSYLHFVGEAGGCAVVVLGQQDPPARRPAGCTLSNREREVIELMARALTNSQIARSLGITEGTVKQHVSSIFSKLQAVSRLDAVSKYSRSAL